MNVTDKLSVAGGLKSKLKLYPLNVTDTLNVAEGLEGYTKL